MTLYRPNFYWNLVAAMALVALLVLVGIAALATQGRSESPERTHAIGDSVHVGNTTFALRGAWWSDRLANSPMIDRRPEAKFLFVVVAVRNEDGEARALPTFRLIDEDGAAYDSQSSGLTIDRALGLITDLEPVVSKQGVVVFDVPPGRTYWLEVDAGSWVSESALIKVVPAEKR